LTVTSALVPTRRGIDSSTSYQSVMPATSIPYIESSPLEMRAATAELNPMKCSNCLSAKAPSVTCRRTLANWRPSRLSNALASTMITL
jgi:hypothetical protein